MAITFTAGQKLTAAQLNAAFGTASMIVYTASGSFTQAQMGDAKAVRVRVQAAGGGSGGCPATTAAQASASAGGGGGGYAEAVLPLSSLTFPVTVTVGAGGTAGTNAPGPGGNGGTSSFGALVVALGGVGGQQGIISAGASITANPADGGNGSVGQVLLSGSMSTTAYIAAIAPSAIPSAGGSSVMAGSTATAGNGTVTGVAGKVYGGGASGSLNGLSQAARVGAAGAPGIVIVELIY